MLHFIAEYGLFFAKIITVVIAILVIVGFIAALSSKDKSKAKLKVKKLNCKFKELRKTLEQKILGKKELKQQAKVEKKSKKAAKKAEQKPNKKRIFLLNFKGDIKASAADSLREEITAILQIATTKDEVVIKIESPGGIVSNYGFAASQLRRLRDNNIRLVAFVDRVAASGGYLMAAVADQIIAAPFAIIGSIGVVGQLPSFHRFLKKHNIDFEQMTAGEYKRTLSMFGENTSKGRAKFQEDIDEAHKLFKLFVAENRPLLDIDRVATGEYWYGHDAIALGLIDKINTSDEYLLAASKTTDIYEIKYEFKKKLTHKLSHATKLVIDNVIKSTSSPL